MLDHCLLPALALIAFCAVAWIVWKKAGTKWVGKQ